jgi:DNA recombination protein RmuC
MWRVQRAVTGNHTQRRADRARAASSRDHQFVIEVTDPEPFAFCLCAPSATLTFGFMELLVPLAALAGLAAGALLAWMALRAQFRRDLSESVTTQQATVGAAQALFHQTTKRLGEVQGELTRTRDELDRTRADAADLRELHARVATELEHERQRVPSQLALLEQSQQQLKDSFDALAAGALRSSNEEFLRLAQERLGSLQKETVAEITKKQESIDALVSPIKSVLAQVDSKLGEVEKNRVQTGAEIASLLEAIGRSQTQLRNETTNLVRALRTPTVRGRWGELQLRRVVEMAGMLEYCDFNEQSTQIGDAGRLRPDLLVRLPGNRTVVVDAKVPLEAYLDAQELQDEAVRERKLNDHARLVREHMTKLGQKGYWEQFQPSPEFVVMFLPGEAIFQAALQQDGRLIEFGVGAQVFPASPLTLIALLRAVAHGWRQERVTRNAEQVSRLGRELYDRVRMLTDRFETLRGRLDGTVKAFNETVGTYDSRVLVTARKLRELGAASGEDIDGVAAVDGTPRSPLGVPRLWLAQNGNGEHAASPEAPGPATERAPQPLALDLEDPVEEAAAAPVEH